MAFQGAQPWSTAREHRQGAKAGSRGQGAEPGSRAWDAQIREFSARTLRFGRPIRQETGSRAREQSQGAKKARAGGAAHRGPKVVSRLLILENALSEAKMSV